MEEKERVIDVETNEEDIIIEEVDKIKEELSNNGDIKLQFYEKLRKKLRKKLPPSGKLEKISDYLFLLPDFFVLLTRLLLDDRVTTKTKGFILGVVSYVILPIDIIPDFIPVIGFIDDLILVVFALDQILKHTDEKILEENWSGELGLLLTIKNIMGIADQAVSHRVMHKIKRFLNRMKNK
ncbi:MAG: YkvA family protein [Candidatus Cloacimonas sp.]|nr:DUF1232 domain-containing protein [Candidatus Cloacimonadota bacterium]